jgi:hypothetical protein
MSSSFDLFEVFRRPISSLYQDLYFTLLYFTLLYFIMILLSLFIQTTGLGTSFYILLVSLHINTLIT